MANTQITADGYAISVWWALPNYAADPSNPTAAELNATRDITCEVAWENFSFGSQASNQTSDPALCDVGNTQTRGFAQFGGTMSFFYPDQYADLTQSDAATFAAFQTADVVGYVIIRVDGEKTTAGSPTKSKPAANGDFISIYKVQADGWSDVNTGETNFKYTITFLPQGDVWVNTVVGPATVATLAPIGTPEYTVDGKTPIGAYLTGRQLAAVTGEWNGYPGWFRWTSSDSTVATVDANGVVTGVSTGSADITATFKNTGATSAPLAVAIA